MRVVKLQNSNYGNLNNKHNSVYQSNDQQPAESRAQLNNRRSSDKPLIATQPVEYKRINSERWYVDNGFLTQYIDQVSKRRQRRDYIGDKPAWQVKNSYDNAANVINIHTSQSLDKLI